MGSTSSTANMAGPEAQLVKSTVQSSPVVVFSKSYCPHCRQAKGILGERGVQFQVLELDKRPDGQVMQDVLGQMTDARTVPRIFINGECIGGCSELKSLLQSGKLDQMLQPL